MSQQQTVDILFDSTAREKLREGAEIVYKVVTATLGPRGKNVVIQRDGTYPIVTKDGVTCARAIHLRDRFKDLGAQVIKQAASQTNESAGDGTTTATELAYSVLSQGLDLMNANPKDPYVGVELKKGLDAALEVALESLNSQAVPVSGKEQIAQVGTISANGEFVVGELLADAIEKVKAEGTIIVEDGKTYKTSMDITNGTRLNSGIINNHLVTNTQKGVFEADYPMVFVIDGKIEDSNFVTNIIELASMKENNAKVVIFAEDVTHLALTAMVYNHTKFKHHCTAITTRPDMARDIATLAGCEVIYPDNNGNVSFKNIEKYVGIFKKVIANNKRTIVFPVDENYVHPQIRFASNLPPKQNIPYGDRVYTELNKAINEIRQELSDSTKDSDEKFYLSRRLGILVGGAAIIRVGGATDVEVRERKDRVEDALNATLAAVEAGIVPGGGVALLRTTKALKKFLKKETDNLFKSGSKTIYFLKGIEILIKACESPIRKMLLNSGCQDIESITSSLLNSPSKKYGFNVATGKFGDMINMGVIDPVKVTKTALENAVSAAGMMLTVDASVVIERNDNETVITVSPQDMLRAASEAAQAQG